MAHHPSYRRNLQAPALEPNPSPDLIQHYKPSFLVKHLASLNLSQTHKHSTLIDTHSHAKAITTSTKEEEGAVNVPTKITHEEMPRFDLERRKPGDSNHNGVVQKEKPGNPRLEKQDVVVHRMPVSLSGGGGGGRRRSFCGSQVNLRDVFAINGAKMVSVDMPPFMQIHAVDSARKALDSMEKFTSKTLALSLKKNLSQWFDWSVNEIW